MACGSRERRAHAAYTLAADGTGVEPSAEPAFQHSGALLMHAVHVPDQMPTQCSAALSSTEIILPHLFNGIIVCSRPGAIAFAQVRRTLLNIGPKATAPGRCGTRRPPLGRGRAATPC